MWGLLDKQALENCLGVVLLALSLVMAGTGHVVTFKLIRGRPPLHQVLDDRFCSACVPRSTWTQSCTARGARSRRSGPAASCLALCRTVQTSAGCGHSVPRNGRHPTQLCTTCARITQLVWHAPLLSPGAPLLRADITASSLCVIQQIPNARACNRTAPTGISGHGLMPSTPDPHCVVLLRGWTGI